MLSAAKHLANKNNLILEGQILHLQPVLSQTGGFRMTQRGVSQGVYVQLAHAIC